MSRKSCKSVNTFSTQTTDCDTQLKCPGWELSGENFWAEMSGGGNCPRGMSQSRGYVQGNEWGNVERRKKITMQDHTSLHVAVMICATLVNTDRQLLTNYTISSAENTVKHVRTIMD